MIKVYKIIKSVDKVLIELFQTNNTNTISIVSCGRHSLKLAGNNLKLILKDTFLVRQ